MARTYTAFLSVKVKSSTETIKPSFLHPQRWEKAGSSHSPAAIDEGQDRRAEESCDSGELSNFSQEEWQIGELGEKEEAVVWMHIPSGRKGAP